MAENTENKQTNKNKIKLTVIIVSLILTIAAVISVLLLLGMNESYTVTESNYTAHEITDSYVTTLTIASKDRSGLVMDIATVLNALNAKVRTLSSRSIGGGLALTVVTLEVKNAAELRYITNKLSSVPAVTGVSRNGA